MKFFDKKILSKGFTLIELLVVISIIGILASIILASLSTARAKGRDAKRLSDVKEIQLALELYFDACGNYPITIYGTSVNGSSNYCGSISSGVGLVAGGYISSVPTDPSYASTPCTDGTQQSCYPYVAIYPSSGAPACSSQVTSYHLGTTLETSDPSLANDADAAKNSNACNNGSFTTDFYGLAHGGVGTQCGGAAGTQYPGTETCYDMTP